MPGSVADQTLEVSPLFEEPRIEIENAGEAWSHRVDQVWGEDVRPGKDQLSGAGLSGYGASGYGARRTESGATDDSITLVNVDGAEDGNLRGQREQQSRFRPRLEMVIDELFQGPSAQAVAIDEQHVVGLCQEVA